MHARHIVLALFVAAVTLISVASAGPAAAKQRVSITSKGFGTPSGQFVFTPLQAGTLKRDSGADNSVFSRRSAIRDGLRVEIEDAVTTSDGKRGSFVIRHRVEWSTLGADTKVGFGTWTFVRGTGQYAQISGRGRSAWVFLKSGLWRGRVEGLLAAP